MIKHKNQKPRPVNFRDDVSDHECALYAAMGFSTKFIKRETSLTPSKITYRIRKAGLTRDNGASRTDFRDGTSPFAAPLLKLARPIAEKQLEEFLDKHL